MDYDVAETNHIADERGYELEQNGGFDSVEDDDRAGHEVKRSIEDDESIAGKLFVGGIAWETTEDTFKKYFSKYGEIIDSVIMMDKISGRPRGFGFVTFADPDAANRVLQDEHFIDGRAVEVKKTVPREDMQVKGTTKTKKVFVGGLPLTLTEDELKEYFSSYGNIVEHQIMLDRETGRSRGFGFVTFDSEDAVESIFSQGYMHELGGKRVEIKRAEPKRAGDRPRESRTYRGGTGSKSYSNFGGGSEDFGGGYGGKMGREYGGYGAYGGYGSYGNYVSNYAGATPGFYAGYGGGYGYGYGFNGPMYGGAGYGGGNYNYGGPAGYGGGKGYGAGAGAGGSWYESSKGYGGAAAAAGYGAGRGYGSGAGGGAGSGRSYGNGGSSTERFHPYRK